MKDILYEIPPLSSNDCFYIAERRKSEFTYPIHRHKELEINFVQGAVGAQRVVGDSVETIGNLDLAMIGSEELEHGWNQGTCTNRNIREITIQFDKSIFTEELLSKNQFDSIKTMLEKARYGISFSEEAILKVYAYLDRLSESNDSFNQLILLLMTLNTLSCGPYKTLASTMFTEERNTDESNRIKRIKEHIHRNFRNELTLGEIAAAVGMSPSSLCRYFKSMTGKTLTSYILDARLGDATRALVNTSDPISEICYSSGFNNVSNFNRLFKKCKNLTPKEFRKLYKKRSSVI